MVETKLKNLEPDSISNSNSKSTPKVGIILPPSDMEKTIDKIIERVSTLGDRFEQFEELTKKREQGNSKLAFLFESSPYHAYYRSKVIAAKGLTENKENEVESVDKGSIPLPEKAEDITDSKDESELSRKAINTVDFAIEKYMKNHYKNIDSKAKYDPLIRFQLAKPKGISLAEDEIIKLVARYTTRNGSNFEQQLWQRPEYGFVHGTHPYHSYYKTLQNNYKQILEPSDYVINNLSALATEPFLNISYHYSKVASKIQKEKENEEKLEKEREEFIEMSKIDWHNFVIVDTIEFDEVVEKDDMDVSDSDVDMEASDDEIAPAPVQVDVAVMLQVCPICNQEIPVDELEEHMRIELLDPKWKKQKEIMQERKRGTNIATGDEIASNIKNFASRRTDIFEKTAEQEKLKQKSLENAKKILWDGSAKSAISAVKAQSQLDLETGAMDSYIKAKKAKEEEEQRIGPSIVPSTFQQMPVPQHQPLKIVESRIRPQPGPEVKSYKRVKITKFDLLSEDEFISKFYSKREHTTIKIKIPASGGKPEWGFNGQEINLDNINVRNQLKKLKNALSPLLGNMPPKKMKFKSQNLGFLKDDKTLAFYNFHPNSTIELIFKTR